MAVAPVSKETKLPAGNVLPAGATAYFSTTQGTSSSAKRAISKSCYVFFLASTIVVSDFIFCGESEGHFLEARFRSLDGLGYLGIHGLLWCAKAVSTARDENDLVAYSCIGLAGTVFGLNKETVNWWADVLRNCADREMLCTAVLIALNESINGILKIQTDEQAKVFRKWEGIMKLVSDEHNELCGDSEFLAYADAAIGEQC